MSASAWTCGRGPTRLMSPVRTFHSCGSSSSLQLPQDFPIGVMRGSAAAVEFTPDLQASRNIVRNLSMRNSPPPRATLVRRRGRVKRSSHTAAAIRTNAGASKISAASAIRKSNPRFITRLPPASAVAGRASPRRRCRPHRDNRPFPQPSPPEPGHPATLPFRPARAVDRTLRRRPSPRFRLPRPPFSTRRRRPPRVRSCAHSRSRGRHPTA